MVDRVKVSENFGATSVAPVAPVVTSLHKCCKMSIKAFEMKTQYFSSNKYEITHN